MMDLRKARKRYLPMSETMFLILFSLRQERHGYGIMQHVKQITQGRIELGAGTVYQSLAKLEGDGLIRATQEVERKKQYQITALGREILHAEAQRLRGLAQLAAEMEESQ